MELRNPHIKVRFNTYIFNLYSSIKSYIVFCLHADEEENFHHILYKENRQDKINMISLALTIKTKQTDMLNTSIISLLNNEGSFDFENFIKKSLFMAPQNDTKLYLKLNNIIATPMSDEFELNYLLSLKNEFLSTLYKVGKNIPKYNLIIHLKESKLDVTVDCTKLILDIFSNYKKKNISEELALKKNIYY